MPGTSSGGGTLASASWHNPKICAYLSDTLQPPVSMSAYGAQPLDTVDRNLSSGVVCPGRTFVMDAFYEVLWVPWD